MDYKINEINLAQTFEKLNIDYPSSLCFIPENIDSAEDVEDFIFTDSISDISKVFRLNKLEFSVLGGNTTSLRSRKNADIFVPALFFSLSLLNENPQIVAVSLGVLSNYITEFFRGSFGRKNVNLDIYVETTNIKKIQKISYNGSIEGIKKLEEVIKSLK